MFKINSLFDLLNFRAVASAGEANIMMSRDTLQSLNERLDEAQRVNIQYALKRLNHAVEITEALKRYVYRNVDAIAAGRGTSRADLVIEIMRIFGQVSQIAFDEIEITDEASREAAEQLLSTLKSFQTLIPKKALKKELKTCRELITEKYSTLTEEALNERYEKLLAQQTTNEAYEDLEYQISLRDPRQGESELPAEEEAQREALLAAKKALSEEEKEFMASMAMLKLEGACVTLDGIIHPKVQEETYVLAEPAHEIEDVEALYEYVQAELQQIDNIQNLAVKNMAYQALQAYADATLKTLVEWSIEDFWGNPLDTFDKKMKPYTPEQKKAHEDLLALTNAMPKKVLAETAATLQSEYEALEKKSKYTRLKGYHALQQKLGAVQQVKNLDDERLHRLAGDISQAMLNDSKRLIKVCGALIDEFEETIEKLRQRSRRVSPEVAEKKYLPAIHHAEDLLDAIQKSREAFEKTGNLVRFKEEATKILDDFEGADDFQINRSNRVFQKYFSGPFEQLRLVMILIITAVSILFPEKENQAQANQQPRFFRPTPTATTTAFEIFEKALRSIGEDRKEEDENDSELNTTPRDSKK